jgi:hypothetical protein
MVLSAAMLMWMLSVSDIFIYVIYWLNFHTFYTRALIFHVSIRPFHNCQNWPCDFDLGVRPTFENFNPGYTMVLVFHICGNQHLWPCNLDLDAWLAFLKLLPLYFLNDIYTMALIFHIANKFLWTRLFHGYQNFFNLWPWPCCLTYLLKILIYSTLLLNGKYDAFDFTYYFLILPLYWCKSFDLLKLVYFLETLT